MWLGKDTIGKIIQYLVWKSRVEKGELPLSVYSFSDFARETSFGKNQSTFEIKKFADTLKDIVCLLIGCTRKQLEDQEFKNTELGEEWWYYLTPKGKIDYQEYEKLRPLVFMEMEVTLVKLTPRLLLQLLGTECGRDILHPNIWVNSLFSDYKEDDHIYEIKGSNWIITDMRFPNELKAVKKRGGITIRVSRTGIHTPKIEDLHPSETALDNCEFDYHIDNSSSIEDLIHTVSLILKREKII